MKFKELRQNIKNLVQNRKQDHFSEISQEDIDLIKNTKYEIPIKTLFCLGTLCTLKFSFRFLHLPKLWVNPLADTEGLIYKNRIWSKVMPNHLIFLGTMSCLLIYAVKYEVIKFYLFLKYENLVHKYMDALDKRQILYLTKKDSEKL